MNVEAFIFTAEPLGDAKITLDSLKELELLNQFIMTKIGRVIKKHRRLYRVPMHEKSTMLYNQYALIAYQGEKSDCLIEIVCNNSVKIVKWPNFSDVTQGKRLTIEVVDWVDAYLLIEYLMTEIA